MTVRAAAYKIRFGAGIVSLGNEVYLADESVREELQAARTRAHAANDRAALRRIIDLESHLMRTAALRPSMIADTKRLLEHLQVSHAVIGGLAVGVHAHPRATDDIDLLVDGAQVEAQSHRLRDPAFMKTFNFHPLAGRRGQHWLLSHQHGSIELLGAGATAHKDLRALALKHAAPHGADLCGLPVVAAEHLVGLKLAAWESDPKRMAKDRGDIISVLGAQGDSLPDGALGYLNPKLQARLRGVTALNPALIERLLGSAP